MCSNKGAYHNYSILWPQSVIPPVGVEGRARGVGDQIQPQEQGDQREAGEHAVPGRLGQETAGRAPRAYYLSSQHFSIHV